MSKSYPYKGKFRISYPFGVKDSSYASGYHCGVDLVGVSDKNIYAINDGEIVLITTNDNYGNHVVQSLPDGTYAYYSHLASIAVSVGDTVTSGKTKIGVEGSTGHVTGQHLDIRISKYAKHTNVLSNFSSVPGYLGFANTDELIINPESEEEEVTNIVLCSHGVDERAAGYLADYLQCGIVFKGAISTTELAKCENVYEVGGTQTYAKATKFISGDTRYETCQEVLDFIAGK